MVCDWVLDYLQQLDRGLRCCDTKLVKQLNHQTREPLERPRYPGGRIDLDQDVIGRPYVDLEILTLWSPSHTFATTTTDLQKSGSVQRTVKEHQQTLVGDVGPGSGKLSPGF